MILLDLALYILLPIFAVVLLIGILCFLIYKKASEYRAKEAAEARKKAIARSRSHSFPPTFYSYKIKSPV
jgi:uncharacterized membrane protein